MGVLQDDWRRASRGDLHESPVITDDGMLLGYGTVLIRRSHDGYELDEDAERFLCLASIAQRRLQSPGALHCLRRAFESWRQGDKALAHTHLAFGHLPRIRRVEEAWSLHQAEALINGGMAPIALARELGFDLKSPRKAMLSSFYGRVWLEEAWIKQADAQINRAKGRTVD